MNNRYGIYASNKTERGSRRCPTDLKFMCRIVGLHARRDLPRGECNLLLAGVERPLEILDVIIIPGNMRCIVAQEPIEEYRKRLLTDLEDADLEDPEVKGFQERLLEESRIAEPGVHTILAFNWFSPNSLYSHVSLGLQLITQTDIDPKFNKIASVYLKKSEDFLWSKELLRYFEITRVTSAASYERSAVKKLTLTGFSLGGAIAQSLAFLLRETKEIQTPIRVIAFGSPRVGNTEFAEWFYKSLDPDSCTMIMSDVVEEANSANILVRTGVESTTKRVVWDPVCVKPVGFDFSPACLILDKLDGAIRPLSELDRQSILGACSRAEGRSAKRAPKTMLGRIWDYVSVDHEESLLWDQLHSIVKYFEAMTSS